MTGVQTCALPIWNFPMYPHKAIFLRWLDRSIFCIFNKKCKVELKKGVSFDGLNHIVALKGQGINISEAHQKMLENDISNV